MAKAIQLLPKLKFFPSIKSHLSTLFGRQWQRQSNFFQSLNFFHRSNPISLSFCTQSPEEPTYDPQEARQRQVKPDHSKLAKAAAESGDLSKGFQLMDTLKEMNITPSADVYNSMVNALLKEKRVQDVDKLLDEMHVRNDSVSVVTYNKLISAYCKLGQIEGAFKARERMKKKVNLKPTVVTSDKENQREDMKAADIAADSYTYSILFDGYYR